MKLHELKTDPEVFNDVWEGKKDFEIRFDDRGFENGDILYLRETAYTGEEMKKQKKPLAYTGRTITAIVTYKLTGYGLKDGWCVLGIVVVHQREDV